LIPETLRHYRILGKLGEGGMGEVYLAEDTSLHRRVAVKLLREREPLDGHQSARLIHEARAAAALDHPYACAIHEVSAEEGRPYIVMEYVEGETLAARLQRGPLPPEEAVRLAGEIAEALEAAHSKGLVHRDLKPANVMITPTGHVKVMDFGLAKAVASAETAKSDQETLTALTGAGLLVGTLAYMSPEQLRGLPLDGRSDLFALGILLHEAVSGVHPFRRGTSPATVGAILSEEPPALPEAVVAKCPGLPGVLDRLLAKPVSARYATMTETREALALARTAGDRIRVPEPRRTRRRWGAVAGTLALAGAIVAGLVITRQLASPARALAFRERDWILVTDFDNQTGEPVFDSALETALTVSLQQSAYVNVFPRSRVSETLKRMRRADTPKLDEALGREVALREGLKAVVAGSIGRIGDAYVLSARLMDPGTLATVHSESSRAPGRSGVLEALDALASGLRRSLGESLNRIGRQQVPLPRATTSSLEALSCYARAMHLRAGAEATPLLEQAVALDPDFALAHVSLGRYMFVSNRRAEGDQHFERALGLVDRLTTRESLWIRAVVTDWRGDRERGIEGYRAYLARYPDDAGAWFALGYACQVTGRPEPGADAFREAIRLDPGSGSAHVNLATCLAGLGRRPEAVKEYERAFALDHSLETGIFVNHEYGFLLVSMGREEDAARGFEKMLAGDDAAWKARGHRSLALLAMYRGRYVDAETHLREAVRLSQTVQQQLSEMRDRLYLANAHLTRGLKPEFERELAEVTRLRRRIKPDPSFLYLIARTAARFGRAGEAEALLREVESELDVIVADSAVDRSNAADRGYWSLLRGEVALARGRHEEALEAFRLARGYGSHVVESYGGEGEARTHARRGELDLAIRSYEEFRRKPELGYELQEAWVLAPLDVGRIHERRDEIGQAVEQYRRFVDAWREGDANLPALVEARARLARLERRPSH
jgi:eukaryotic-like serine/threonine-protein kinase